MEENNIANRNAPSAWTPVIDKVGIPLLWLATGYLLATFMQRPRRQSSGS